MSLVHERFDKYTNTTLGLFCLLVLVGFLGGCLYARYLANIGSGLTLGTLAPYLILFGASLAAVWVLRLVGVSPDPVLSIVIPSLFAMGVTFAARFSSDGYGAYRYVLCAVSSLVVMVVVALAVQRSGLMAIARHRHALCVVPAALLLAPMPHGHLAKPSSYDLWLEFGLFELDAGMWAMLVAVVIAACGIAGVEARHVMGESGEPDATGSVRPTYSLGFVMLLALALYVFGAAYLAIALLVSTAAMLYVNEERSSYTAPLIAALVLTLVAVVQRMGLPRLIAWLSPSVDPWGGSYQTLQSLAAIKRGFVFGTGVGLGTPDQVPIVQDDFIFSAICEELGLVGGLAVICLYALMAVRGIELAGRASSNAVSLLVTGLACLTAIDALTAMGCATGLLPASSSLLPCLARGANSMLGMVVRIGVMLGAPMLSGYEEGVAPEMLVVTEGRLRSLRRVIVLGFVVVAVHLVLIVLL